MLNNKAIILGRYLERFYELFHMIGEYEGNMTVDSSIIKDIKIRTKNRVMIGLADVTLH